VRELPVGWTWSSLGAAAEVLDAQRVPVNASERAKRSGSVPYYGATGQVGWIDDALFDEELVLLGEDAAPFLDPFKPKAYLIGGPSWVNNHAHVLRATVLTSNRFLKYSLDALDYHDFVTGTTRLKLTKSAMLRMQLALPPLDQQQRIVDALEEHLSRLDDAVAAMHRVDRRLAVLRRTVLAESVSGPWPVVRLGDLLADIEAGKSFRTTGSRARPDEWGVIKVSAMTWGQFDENENKAIPPERPVDPRYEIKAGDLLLSRANTSDYVGATVLVRECRPKLVLSDKSMRLMPTDNVDRRWLWYALSSPRLREQMSLVATGTSDSMRNISQEKVRALELPLPSLDRQLEAVQTIEALMSVVDQQQARVSTALSRSRVLRASLLSSAFAGRLVRSVEPAGANCV